MTFDDRILQLVAEHEPMSSAEIWMALGWRKWLVNFYPRLMRLESNGRLRSQWGDGPYPRRRLYSLVHSSK